MLVKTNFSHKYLIASELYLQYILVYQYLSILVFFSIKVFSRFSATLKYINIFCCESSSKCGHVSLSVCLSFRLSVRHQRVSRSVPEVLGFKSDSGNYKEWIRVSFQHNRSVPKVLGAESESGNIIGVYQCQFLAQYKFIRLYFEP